MFELYRGLIVFLLYSSRLLQLIAIFVLKASTVIIRYEKSTFIVAMRKMESVGGMCSNDRNALASYY